ncbi:hypothetical protein [Halolamina salifodinae]|uniref:Uncharacterized protein n=1 Tax=Halolamina salifodinae TaxID=1202767 RepID=A0A8T4GX96_9EURY|nr:hypothetical protein [Halolamina salifodinae]MBP1987566.1 hypothetical protein [Halolamina salifodinae]
MNLYRTSESGLVPVQPLGTDETDGLAGALLRGRGGPLGAENVLFVETTVEDDIAAALAVDAAGTAVVVGAADGEVGSDVVTDALQRASAVADSGYEALAERFEGDEELRAAHAAYFNREPLAPAAFNDDQRVRLLGTAFAEDALELASFLSDRELAVDAVPVEAFGDPASDQYLARFDVDEETADAGAGADSTDGSEQWVAGGSAVSASEDGNAGAEGTDEPVSEESTSAKGATGTEQSSDEPLDLPVLLDAVAEGVKERLRGTFDADPERLASLERGNELLVRPNAPAYAGGVLRYRMQTERDGTVEFGVSIYGGSEAEKEQMRALIRDHEAAIEEELGYEVSDRYDGFHAEREFPTLDQVAASEIVDEFDRLVRFFHPRVMRT